MGAMGKFLTQHLGALNLLKNLIPGNSAASTAVDNLISNVEGQISALENMPSTPDIVAKIQNLESQVATLQAAQKSM